MLLSRATSQPSWRKSGRSTRTSQRPFDEGRETAELSKSFEIIRGHPGPDARFLRRNMLRWQAPTLSKGYRISLLYHSMFLRLPPSRGRVEVAAFRRKFACVRSLSAMLAARHRAHCRGTVLSGVVRRASDTLGNDYAAAAACRDVGSVTVTTVPICSVLSIRTVPSCKAVRP